MPQGECYRFEYMASIRRAVADDAQKIGVVFNAAVREGWTYLGELARAPMFPPDEWDKLVIEHAPPNVLLVAIDDEGGLAGFTTVHPSEGEMYLLFVHPEHAGRGVGRALLNGRMKSCEPRAAAKRSSTRTNKTKERCTFMRPPGTGATASCANRTFAVFICASRGC